MRCPICKKEVAFDDPEMPFCSERCRLIDLGNWAAEKYVISTPIPGSELEDTDERAPRPDEGLQNRKRRGSVPPGDKGTH